MSATERLERPLGSATTLAGIGLGASAIIIFAGNYKVAKGENGGLGPAIVTAIICLVLTAALFGYVVPRAQNTDRTSLILGVVGLLSIVAFWSGVTPILAAAAVAVGRRSEALSRPTLVFQVLAVLAAAVALVGTVAQSHLF